MYLFISVDAKIIQINWDSLKMRVIKRFLCHRVQNTILPILVEFLLAGVKQVVPLLFGRAADRLEKPATSAM